jgi:hypothetical protein
VLAAVAVVVTVLLQAVVTVAVMAAIHKAVMVPIILAVAVVLVLQHSNEAVMAVVVLLFLNILVTTQQHLAVEFHNQQPLAVVSKFLQLQQQVFQTQ